MRENDELHDTTVKSVYRLDTDYVRPLTVSREQKSFAGHEGIEASKTVSTMNTTLVSTLRIAGLADAPEISNLVNGAYRGESGAQGWTTEAHLLGGLRTDEERVRDLILAENSVVLLKDVDDAIEGCVHLERKNESTAYLGMLTTNSRAQARGTGSALLKGAEDFAKSEWQASRIEMTVITVRTELIDWYIRRGYRLTGEKRPFPTDPRFGIPLVENLEFVVLDKLI